MHMILCVDILLIGIALIYVGMVIGYFLGRPRV